MDIRNVMIVFVAIASLGGVGSAQNAESPTVVQGGASDPRQAEPAQEAVGLSVLPASFEGSLPSADGPRILHHLDLLPGRVFVLRRHKPGSQDPPLDAIGTWAISTDGERLMLKDAHRVPIVFAIAEGGDLRMLDADGRVMEPHIAYSLTRLGSFLPVEPRLFLRGLYRDTGEGGIFQECATGWRLLVAEDGDYAAMESAYSQTRHEPGESLFVTLRGRIVQGHEADGGGTRMLLVPERFLGMWPGETCDPPR